MTPPVRLGVFPTAASTPTGVFNQRFKALFPPSWSPGLRSLLRSPAAPPGLSICECGTSGSASGHAACPIRSTICQSLGSAQQYKSSPPQLPVSAAPPTGLDECFFFISLVVGLSCGSIFCQFWLFLLLNCRCPSFGCVRRCSVSTYTSILVLSHKDTF